MTDSSMRTIPDVLAERVRTSASRRFVKCDGDWLSYADVERRSAKLAAGLEHYGVVQGDRVAVLMPNRQEFLELFFAVARLGAVIVPLNIYLKGEFLRYQLIDCEAKIFAADDEGLRAAASVLPHTKVATTVALDAMDETLTSVGAVPYADLQNHGAAFSAGQVGPADPMAISYTSGTTGMPKGCVLSHGYYTSMHRGFSGRGWFQDDDILLTTSPLYNTGGHGMYLMIALCGAVPTIFVSRFSASRFINQVRAEGATVLHATGMIGVAVLAQPPTDTDWDNPIRIAAFVPMTVDQQHKFSERFDCATVAGTYGQTERVPACTMPYPFPEDKRATAGLPVDDIELRVVDDNDDEVGVGEVGEIVLRPRVPHTMYSGYWRQPEKTVEAWRNLWHHTGDLGQVDADGYLSYVDRKKDSMRVRGNNVSSFELEQAILLHPAIAAAAAYACASDLSEDEIMVAVVAQPGATITAQDLFDHLKDAVPYFAVPRYVSVREALPVNGVGRVMKHTLRDEGLVAGTVDCQELGLTVDRAYRRSSSPRRRLSASENSPISGGDR